MSGVYELPPILSGSAENQLRQLRDYLVRMARELPGPDSGKIEAAVAEAVQRSGRSSGQDAAAAARSQAARLKDLIVKTADEIYTAMDRIETDMSGLYVAKSDFGEYTETVETTIVQTARDTVESFNFQAQIDAATADRSRLEQYLTQISGEIRRGVIIDPDSGDPVLGIAISQNLSFTGNTQTEAGLVYYELTPGQTFGLYTSTGWQFWINGVKRGWFDSEDGMLHVAQIVVEDRLQLGDGWLMTSTNGFGVRYIGG